MHFTPNPSHKTAKLTQCLFVALAIFAILTTATPVANGAEQDKANETKKETFRDRLWLWSHLAGCYNGQYNLKGNSKLAPEAAAKFLGMNNICMIRYGGKPVPNDFAQHMQSFTSLDNVAWSVVGDGSTHQTNAQDDLKAVLALKQNFGNLSAAVLDDFFIPPRGGVQKSRISLDELKNIQTTLHEHGLKLWVVLYDHQLDWDIGEYLKYCDVVTFWTWKSEDLDKLKTNFQKAKQLAHGKPIMAGCYMYDFGNQKPISVSRMQSQCEEYYRWIKSGEIEGIIFCGSCVADLDLEAVKWTKGWISKIGDQKID
jgi:hypothetical protein